MVNTEVGKLVNWDAKRDAIHIAVYPAIAEYDIRPGSAVGLNREGKAIVVAFSGPAQLGVADPFLCEMIKAGERFWIFLNPNTVTDMRHQWTHPVIPDEATETPIVELSQAKAFLIGFGESHDLTYDELMAVLDDGGVQYGFDMAHGEIDDSVWLMYEIVAGRKRPSDAQDYFSCSC